MASVALENLSKNYGTFIAVNDIDISIGDGEFVVLVGASGCGKSTTLRMVAGLEAVSNGTIRIGDRLVNDLSPRERDIAMVFQDYALYPHMTVFENISFGLAKRGLGKPEIRATVRNAAAMLGIEALLQRKPRELSGGQRQRVAMGRAIVRKPQVFLLDEPLSNLDAKLRNSMRTELKQLHAELGTTFIYVTHDQTEAMTLADRVVVMNDGRIEQIGTPHDIYNRPRTLYVAGFIGSPVMNLVSAQPAGRGKIDLEEAGHLDPTQLPGHQNTVIEDEVVVGIRPESFLNQATARQFETPLISATVSIDVVEPLGADTLVFFRLLGQECIARLDAGSQPAQGERIELFVPRDKIFLFDPRTGLRMEEETA